MPLPEPTSLHSRSGTTLMKHQAELVAAASQGHRTFLLADEPGLGKTAQSLLAADAANAFRCSWSCRTSSRRTGHAKPSAGCRTTAPP